jgi:hypothetical protein
VKKKLPVAVWTKIEPLIDKHLTLFRALRPEECAFHLIDLDEESDFDFKCGFEEANGHFRIEYAPVSRESVHRHIETVPLDVLVERINGWASILQEYDDTPSFYDDNEERKYGQYFFERLEIKDSAAGGVPLAEEQQYYLNRYIDRVRETLERYKGDVINGADVNDLRSIGFECDRLQKSIKVVPANETMKRLAKIWAKAQRFSLKLIIDLLNEFRKEAIKKLTVDGMDDLFGFLG